jgi:peptide deformylase
VFTRDGVEMEAGLTPTQDLVFINPELVRASKKVSKLSEGCLSVRGIFGMTKRNEKVSIRAYDREGKRFVWNGTGLIAQIFQHEMDHLEGILFTDHATEVTGDETAS